jgi:hypothetical protein
MIGSPEREDREKGNRIFEKIITKNFPILMKTINLYIQDDQSFLNRINSDKSIPSHTIKVSKTVWGLNSGPHTC